MPLTIVIRDRKSRRRRRFRWWPVALIAILGIMVSLPFWVPDVLRDDLEDAITDRVGMPTHIGDLDVALFPRPILIARDVEIGRPEFNVRARDVTLQIMVTALFSRIADIPSIQITDLVWTVPQKPGDFAEAIGGLEFRSKGPGKWKGIVRRVHAEDARIVYPGEDGPVLYGDAEALNLLASTISLNVNAAVPAAGISATLNGEATLTRQPGTSQYLGVSGTAQLSGVYSNTFVTEEVVPNTNLDFESIAFERTAEDTVTITMAGRSSAASAQAAEVEALAGSFSAIATWEDGETAIRIDEWRAPGFEFTGDIAVNKEGAAAFAVAAGTANAAGVDAYFRLRPLAGYTVTPTPDAALRVSGLRINRSAEGGLALLGGTASFSGIDLLVDDGAQAFTGFGVDLSVAENVVTLERASGEGLSLSGTIAPDFDSETYVVDLAGEAVLTPERVHGFMDAEWLRDVAGHVHVAKLQGTLRRGTTIPDDFVIEGTFKDGRVQIESDDWSDTVEQIELAFSAAEDRITTVSSAQSKMFGAVSVDGILSTTENRWSGTVSGDLSNVELPSVEGATRDIATAILNELGASELEVAVVRPNKDAESVSLTIERRGDGPSINAQIALLRKETEWALGDLAVDANLPSRVVTPLTPSSVEPSGPMAVQFSRSSEQERFQAVVDFASATVTMGDHLSKQTGAPFNLTIDGRATGGDWAAEAIDITLLDTNVRADLDGERLRIEPLDIDLALLSPLLSQGGTASGRVSGTVQSNPTDVDLNLDQVRLALSENLVADNIDGRIRVTDAGVETDGLRVDAANSNFTLDLREENERWVGGVRGTQVDANALEQFADEYRALIGEDASEGVGLAPAEESGQSLLAEQPDVSAEFAQPIREETRPTLEGEFAVDLDTVLYRRAAFSSVRTDLVVSGGNFSAQNLAFTPGSGSASGNVRYTRGEPPHGNRINADIVFNSVDAKVIDDLAFAEPRNLRGLLTGNAMLSMPIRDDGVDLSALGGSVQVKGVDGSLGSLGFANAILFVFKTTEILFLRSPFGEGGLSFDELQGKATIESGVITLGVYEEGMYKEAVTLQRPSYRMSAIGWIDLAGNDSEVIVHMQPLSTVTDAARIFKVDEVEMINNKGGIRIRMTGPPTDPKTQIALGGPVSAITNDIRGGFRSVTGLVRDQILEGIGGLLRDVLER